MSDRKYTTDFDDRREAAGLAATAPPDDGAPDEGLDGVLDRKGNLRRQAEIGTLFETTAQRLRNPLASVLAAADMLTAECEREGRDARFARLIHHETQRVDRIIATLYAFATIDRIEPTALNVAPALEDAVAEAGAGLGDVQVSIMLQPTTEPIRVMGNTDALRTVFSNLIANACEAMSGAGRLRIHVQSNGDNVTIDFQDTGQGLPAVPEERLFDPLFTTRTGALGLGLTLCREVMDRLGGHVTARNAAPRGACTTLHLPAADSRLSMILRTRP